MLLGATLLTAPVALLGVAVVVDAAAAAVVTAVVVIVVVVVAVIAVVIATLFARGAGCKHTAR